MMARDLQEEVSRKFHPNLRFGVFGLLFAGLFLLALGAGLFLFKGESSDEIEIISANGAGNGDPSSQNLSGQVVVHVDGAVTKPGVYNLPSDSRVNDAIGAAGGLTEDADQTRINLAAKVSDGQKVYVYARGEQVGSSAVGSSIAGQSVSSLININIASEAELDKLPGIGPVTAQKIIASRPYSSLEDLLTKKVVSKSVFEKIKEQIVVY